MTVSIAIRPPPSQCGWTDCGHPAPVEVVITVPGKRPRAGSLGRYCIGHAVITGIEAHTLHRGLLWYLPASPLARHTQAASS